MNRNKKPTNSKKKPQNRGNKNARRDVEIRDTAEREYKSDTNDYGWYSRYPQLTASAGTLPFSMPLGEVLDLGINDMLTNSQPTIPGVMNIEFVPTPGYSADNSSAINYNASRTYTYLRGAQKAAASYDGADVFISLLALDSAYIYHEWMRRIYGEINLRSPMNEYLPETLLYLQGVDYQDILKNLGDFRGYINEFAIALGSFCCPASFDLTIRHAWMTAGLYKDSASAQSQIYQFTPRGVWVYNNTVATGSQLDFMIIHDRDASLLTFQDIMDKGQMILSSLNGDEDISRISGDIYNALGSDNVKKLMETPEMYQVVPSYDPVVLSQIENATIFDDFNDNPSNVITQNPTVNNGAIIFKPVVEIADGQDGLLWKTKTLLNYHGDGQPSPEAVIEMTRMHVCVEESEITPATTPNTPGYIAPTAFGADIMIHAVIAIGPIGKTTSTRYVWTRTINVLQQSEIEGGAADIAAWAEGAIAVVPFDWAPVIYNYVDTSDKYTLVGTTCDYDNAVTVQSQQIARMHRAAMFSLFDLPQMGFTTSDR